MKIFYWSPHISHVATVTAVINSIKSVKKYSLDKMQCKLIDSIGEWNDYEQQLKELNIETIKLYKNQKYSNLPRYGFIRSRIAYWIIFLNSFFSLKNCLEKFKPDFLIIHLITSLPILLNFIYNFDTKIILRVSGHPKLNFARWLLWKILAKKIYKVVCPTEATREFLIKKRIFDAGKVFLLRDPIIEVSKINILKEEKIDQEYEEITNLKYLLTIGRLTKQKNYFFLLDCFAELTKLYPEYKLIIIGEGEDEKKLKSQIFKMNLKDKAFILPFKQNIFNFLKRSDCFVMSSLWEDPGFVLAEAVSVNKIVISSDCPNGPSEILLNGEGGYLFNSNDKKSFLRKFELFKNEIPEKIFLKKLRAKKNIKNYTLFRHFKDLKNILVYEK